MSGDSRFKRNLYAKCPYYRREGKDSTSVKCEGLMGDFTLTIFPNKDEMIAHSHAYCCDRYEDCPLCQALDSKWERIFEAEKEEPRV